jgi:hypothetical protein
MEQRKRLGFPWILLSVLNLFNGLRRPPTHFFLFRPQAAPKDRADYVIYVRTDVGGLLSRHVQRVEIVEYAVHGKRHLTDDSDFQEGIVEKSASASGLASEAMRSKGKSGPSSPGLLRLTLAMTVTPG